jgi:hypothetical protein
MDNSNLPPMDKTKFVPIPKVIPQTPRKTKPTPKKRGGVGAVLDIVAARKKRLKEAGGN